jgi:putative nucleotidyltransferase with HDIG domain
MLQRFDAIDLVKKHVSDAKLLNHMISVGAIMRQLAMRLNKDPELWELVGILHDIDYEEVGEDFSRHGLRSAEIVKDLLPAEGVRAIKAHNAMTGVEAESKLELSLFAADAVSGLIVANALVRPSGLEGMKPKSIKRKMKDTSFARQIKRENITRCEEIGLDLDEFLRISVQGMQSVAEEIGF